MTATATVRVMTPEEIASRAAGQTPYFRWSERQTLFAERAMRLRRRHAARGMETNLMIGLGAAVHLAGTVGRGLAIGFLPLTGLPPGASRHLDDKEVQRFRKLLHLDK